MTLLTSTYTQKRVDADSLVFVVELPIMTPSLNELMAWKHQAALRRWKYKAHRSELRKMLGGALGGFPLFQAGEPRRMRVTVTRYSAGTLDTANLVGGCKPLVDTLVELGVLHDDSPAWLEDHYLQAAAPRGTKRTVIEIQEAGA